MSAAENMYTAPRVLSANEIPAGVLEYLNGENLLSKMQAVRLTTVDADGWPKAALLSASDVLALPNGRFRFAIFAGSGTAANLERDGRLALGLSLDGGYVLVAHARPQVQPGLT
jgi:pyridoxamine 5'-phosphate oxidase-like protein